MLKEVDVDKALGSVAALPRNMMVILFCPDVAS